MQYTTIAALVSVLAGNALAAPAPQAATNMMAADSTWTMLDFQRTCDSADTSCHYSFALSTNDNGTTPCAYDVNGSPASTATYQNVYCANYRIGSTHDSQGFQVLSVVRDADRLIIYPGYTDAQLSTGQVVKPDQSYTPQALP